MCTWNQQKTRLHFKVTFRVCFDLGQTLRSALMSVTSKCTFSSTHFLNCYTANVCWSSTVSHDVASCSCSAKLRLFSPQRLLIGPVILELKGILLKLNVISDLLGPSLVITEIAAAKVVESSFFFFSFLSSNNVGIVGEYYCCMSSLVACIFKEQNSVIFRHVCWSL